MKKRILSWLLIFVMCLSIFAGKDITFASEYTNTETGVIINPLYKDIITVDPNVSDDTIVYTDEKLAASDTVYTNSKDAADYLRKQMVNRVTSIVITINYNSNTTTISELANDIWTRAIAYTESCSGREGDALSANYESAGWSASYNSVMAQITYNITYMSNAAQETELANAVAATLKSMNLDGKTDYQKVRAIYDYICDNVDYDYYNLENNPNYDLMYTAYAAMCHGTAVCQGYAVLFYQMCKDAGLSVRFISGIGNGGPHAWNIVRIGDKYYNVDCTWDGQDPETYHDFFLKNKNDFIGHYRSSEYDTAAFHAQFPMATDSWEDYSQLSQPVAMDNLTTFNYTSLNGQTVTNQSTGGRGKILIFGRVECFNTQNTISNISKADFSDVDIIYVDSTKSSKEAVTTFRNTYGSANDDITYTYNLSGTNLWSYVHLLVGNVNNVTFPLIVYIDEDNLVQGYQLTGVYSADSIRQNIKAYFGDTKLISLSSSTLTKKAYEKAKLDVYVRGTIRNPQFLTWTSSNPSVATVDANGTIITKAEGTTTITCTANANAYATCKVTVSGVKELAVPAKPYKIANVVSGVHVYWKEIAGVKKYGLWRSENGKDGDYKWIANPTVPHFTDTKVTSGKTYFYKVTVLDTEFNRHGNKSEAIGTVFTSTPDITSRFNKGAGVQLGWEKIPGATGYGIYRKTYSGNDAWVRIATINSGDTLSYMDTSVKSNNGSVYRYTIRALAGSNNSILSGCRNTGRTMVRLASRVLNSATKVNNTSIKANWTTSSAVTGYEVRFMIGDEVYKTFTIGNYKTGTKTFTGLKAGKTYKVQVRAYKKVDGVGSFYSAWSVAKNISL